VLGLSNRHQHTSDAARPSLGTSFSIGNLVRRVLWMVRCNVSTCTFREVLIVRCASRPSLNCGTDVLTMDELELVTSTCFMYNNVLLQEIGNWKLFTTCAGKLDRLLSLGPVGFPASGRTLPPLIASPPSSMFLSGSLRAHPGPRSRNPMIMKVCRGSRCRRGGGAGHRSRIRRAAGARN
jgi:hypothetical protein